MAIRVIHDEERLSLQVRESKSADYLFSHRFVFARASRLAIILTVDEECSTVAHSIQRNNDNRGEEHQA